MNVILASIILFISMFNFAHAEEFQYSVSGSSAWSKTPYSAVRGEKLVIAANGSVKHSWMSGYHGPQGNSGAFCADCRVTRKCNVAGLIMKIGERGKVYCVDPVLSGDAPASGPIYFAINDFPLNDNDGSFSIILSGPGVTIGGSTFD